MNFFERQNTLGQSLYEINTNTLRELVTLQRENFEKYVETNREFGAKLPEVKDVSGFIDLQRQYGEMLWGSTVGSYTAHTDLIRSAVEETVEAVKTAFVPEAADAEAATVAGEAAVVEETIEP